MARVKNTPRRKANGRVLTAKNLPEKTYQVIHEIPFGMRAKVLHKLLGIAVPYAKSRGEDWYLKLLNGKARIV